MKCLICNGVFEESDEPIILTRMASKYFAHSRHFRKKDTDMNIFGPALVIEPGRFIEEVEV